MRRHQSCIPSAEHGRSRCGVSLRARGLRVNEHWRPQGGTSCGAPDRRSACPWKPWAEAPGSPPELWVLGAPSSRERLFGPVEAPRPLQDPRLGLSSGPAASPPRSRVTATAHCLGPPEPTSGCARLSLCGASAFTGSQSRGLAGRAARGVWLRPLISSPEAQTCSRQRRLLCLLRSRLFTRWLLISLEHLPFASSARLTPGAGGCAFGLPASPRLLPRLTRSQRRSRVRAALPFPRALGGHRRAVGWPRAEVACRGPGRPEEGQAGGAGAGAAGAHTATGGGGARSKTPVTAGSLVTGHHNG